MAFNSGVSSNVILHYMGTSVEEKVRYIYWEWIIETDENNYLTSNTNAEYSVGFSNAKDSWKGSLDTSGLGYTGYTTTPVNTDINDRVVAASGLISVPQNLEKTYEDGTTSVERITVSVSCKLSNIIQVNVADETGTQLTGTVSGGDTYVWEKWDYLDKNYNSYLTLISAGNFTDEGSLDVVHSGIKYDAYKNHYKYFYAYISFDGYNRDIVRSIPHTYQTANEQARTVTFDFTDEEKAILHQKTANAKATEVFVYVASSTDESYKEHQYYGYYKGYCVKRTLTIVNGNPVLSPVIKDTNATTLALTGNENKLVRFHSNAYVDSGVVWQKAATKKTHLITNGSKSITANSGTFNEVESKIFSFTATDSRGFNTTLEMEPSFVDYIKLSCAIEHDLISAATGEFTFTIQGNYYNGDFGATNNNLGVVYRIKLKDTEWGEWIAVPNVLINDTSYTAKVDLTGLNYGEVYELQAMATDRLNTIQSIVYVVAAAPLFDWGEEDFNFNVPVVAQDSLTVEGNTLINGAANFTNFTNFDGLTSFKYTPTFTNGLEVDTATTTFDGNTMADYIIETGTESMGSNGTWKWQKWASGKAEAWGKRNYGNMGFPNTYAIGLYTNASGNSAITSVLYQSERFEQDLPAIFNEEPDVIDINIIKSSYGAFVLRGFDTNASATSTGGFAICKAATATGTTMSAVNLSFHVIGTWK